jgi:chitinase
VTVHYATANGTATAGSDYSAQSGTLTFAAGEASKTIVVPVVGDTTVEANETLTVALSTPSGATIAQASATASGLNVLQTAKNDGVRIDVVDVMAMDYGQSVDNNGQMGQDAISAAVATERQLADMGLVAKIGVTPMIGVNDIASEVFTPADAQSLVDYAKADSQLALLSMWSVARDNGSGAGSHAAAPDNSGVAQQPYQYAGILHQFDRQG